VLGAVGDVYAMGEGGSEGALEGRRRSGMMVDFHFFNDTQSEPRTSEEIRF
jgi:hypothetical protein